LANPVVDTTAMQFDIQAGLMPPLRVLIFFGRVCVS
jgi:uncharacterized protein (DUF302 family)